MDALLSLPLYAAIFPVIDQAPFAVPACCTLRKIKYYFAMVLSPVRRESCVFSPHVFVVDDGVGFSLHCFKSLSPWKVGCSLKGKFVFP